ncbi:MAG: hypothetical protein IPJ19_08750 [Planctomycetes bacterium]|nr:hypothetical protein [Planctomycetota bacterium]
MNGVTDNDLINLTLREDSLGTGMLVQDQRHPSADTDGLHFTYAYAEDTVPATVDYDTFCSTVDVINGQLTVGEFHKPLGVGASQQDFPRMCSREGAGGTGPALAIVWQADSVLNLGNIQGATYFAGDFVKLCTPGYDGVLSCPCGNPPAGFGRGCNNSSSTGGALIEGSGERIARRRHRSVPHGRRARDFALDPGPGLGLERDGPRVRPGHPLHGRQPEAPLHQDGFAGFDHRARRRRSDRLRALGDPG